MVARVYLHIGLPKTGTTYLQEILWSHRDELRAEGIVLPGRGHRDHLWAALDIQERPNLAKRHADAPGTWERLCAELDRESAETGVITHEFFCGATAEQAARAVERLAPAEVHVVVTARHALGMLTAGWQELVKNGSVITPREAAAPRRRSEFSWRTWDLGGVLERWGAAVPPEQIHVVTMPGSGAAADEHWVNFSSVLGVRGEFAPPREAANSSLGVVQVELLRRLNADLGDFHSALDRGEWIRGYLAERHLSAQPAERFGLDEELIDECRRRSDAALDLLRARAIHVVGDIDSLRVPTTLPAARSIESVTSEELLSAASALVASMLTETRAAAASAPTASGVSAAESSSGDGILAGVRRGLMRRKG